MKKRVFIFIISLIGLIGIVFYMITNLFSKVKISESIAELRFVNTGISVCVDLTNEESEIIKEMFNGKRLFYDNPSCGFSDNVSIRFGGLLFCVACDNCPIIKLENKYFRISEEEREALNQMFEERGGFFPCV